jgi:hypothetical protein
VDVEFTSVDPLAGKPGWNEAIELPEVESVCIGFREVKSRVKENVPSQFPGPKRLYRTCPARVPKRTRWLLAVLERSATMV